MPKPFEDVESWIEFSESRNAEEPVALHSAAIAQAKATLAVAEQLRIANMIASMDSAQNAEIAGLHEPEVTKQLGKRLAPIIAESLFNE